MKGGATKGRRYRAGETLTEVPYLRVANVQRGYLDLSEIKTIEVTQDVADQLELAPGDILFTEGGDRDKLGRGWVWKGEIDGCIHQNHVFRSRLLLSEMYPAFVSWWGNSFGQTFFDQSGKQTTNLASINLSVLSSFPVPIPPLAEQRRIVTEVERRLSVIQQAEAAVEANLTRAERLRPEHPKAGVFGKARPPGTPVTSLPRCVLERIRAERAEAEAARPVQPQAETPEVEVGPGCPAQALGGRSMTTSSAVGQKLWNYCNVLRDAGLSYGDYLEQLTFLLFLKMMHERTQPPHTYVSRLPAAPHPRRLRLAQPARS